MSSRDYGARRTFALRAREAILALLAKNTTTFVSLPCVISAVRQLILISHQAEQTKYVGKYTLVVNHVSDRQRGGRIVTYPFTLSFYLGTKVWFRDHKGDKERQRKRERAKACERDRERKEK